MLNSNDNNKIRDINEKRIDTNNVDTRLLTQILNEIKERKAKTTLQDRNIKLLHQKLDYITFSFSASYRELVSVEIKTMNLNVAAEAIKDRDDLVNEIYKTVMNEFNQKICQ